MTSFRSLTFGDFTRQLFAQLEPLERLEGLLDEGARLACESARARAASVFLLSEQDELRRVSLYLRSPKQEAPSADWRDDEEAILPGPGVREVATAVTVGGALARYWSKSTTGIWELEGASKVYRHLGNVDCLAILPLLEGHEGTFGVLEVVGREGGGEFSAADLERLAWLAGALAAAVSRLDQRREQTLLGILGDLLARAATDGETEAFYRTASIRLVADTRFYAGCTIRTCSLSGDPKAVAKFGAGAVWEEYCRYDNSWPPECVLASCQPVVIGDARAQPDRHPEDARQRYEAPRSWVCLPLPGEQEAVGTLSLFSRRKIESGIPRQEFLEQTARLLARAAQLPEGDRGLGAHGVPHQPQHHGAASIHRADEVAHQYRGQLNDLVAALNRSLTAGGEQGVEIVRRQVRRLEARILRIKKALQLKEDVRTNVNHVIQSLAFEAKESWADIEISTDLEKEIPDLSLREEEVREILINLVGNAVKAIRRAQRQKGRIQVTTSIVQIERIRHARIFVGDNGDGIRSEDQDRIYDRGFSRDPLGTGNGLFFVREIVNKLGGKLTFTSTVSQGTTFLVDIPLRRHTPKQG